MEIVYYSLQDFFTEARGLTYILMVAGLAVFFVFWRFLGGRDKDIRKY